MNFLLIFVYIISFYLRVDAYCLNNSLFTDEILLAINVINKNLIHLYFPLDNFQSAPYFFLVLSKLSTCISCSELSLRFIPFLFSLISVLVFDKLCTKVFNKKYCRILALFAFGISYQLLFYTQVFKQYSTDVLFAILSLYFAIRLYENFQQKAIIMFGVYSLIAIYFSFPSFIVSCATYMTFLIFNRKDYRDILLSALFPLLGGAIYYCSNLLFVANSSYLETYWSKGYEVFSLEIYKLNFDFLFYGYKYPILFFILLIMGFWMLYKNNRFRFLLFLSTILLTLGFAALHIYPFERRLCLFILPLLIIIGVYPLEGIKSIAVHKITKVVLIVILSIFWLPGLFNFCKNYVTGQISYLRQDVKPLLQVIKEKRAQDNLYIYYGATYTYAYYAFLNLVNVEHVIFPTIPKDEIDSDKYLENDLNKLPKGTTYLFFVKGTWTWNKDIIVLEKWLKDNCILEDDIQLKSARLIKIRKQ